MGSSVAVRPPTILIPGTWGLDESWWKPGSPLWRTLTERGVELIDEREPFRWTTNIDGVWGKNNRWKIAGESLLWYVRLKHEERKRVGKQARPVNVFAHSHGGQVGLYAAALGLEINVLVTGATPVRKDMECVIRKARPNIRCWLNIRSDGTDWMQWIGEIFDGRLAWPGSVRDFAQADRNVMVPGVGHSGILDEDLLIDLGVAGMLAQEV